MRNLKAKALGLLGTLITLAALVTASAACSWIIHQPKEPKVLRR